eukprot:TRINITY_DN8008_c0_g1_i1.p1 TRINITY_DN8008_c0_g1~~TRINITY_DN8008_c0_g1_i1.p1  ORF type:complete len:1047 (+),score=302.09 TRINITY_DN8008_c0_g1_i1:43-3141(+)
MSQKDGKEGKSPPRKKRSKRPSDSVVVAVRVRPMLKREEAKSAGVVAMKDNSCNVKAVRNDGQVKSKTITIDHCLNSSSEQEETYQKLGENLIDNAWKGFNSSLIAYGQTGSGKTYSVFGPSELEPLSLFTQSGMQPSAGLVPRVFDDILKRVASSDAEYVVEIAMMEIYLERTFDLLKGRVQLDIRGSNELGFFAEKLTRRRVTTTTDVVQALKDGNSHKMVASTALNNSSSRAHTIIEIYVRKLLSDTTSGATSAKITIVDLAGSENVKQSEVKGELLQQASNINLSLMELGRVVQKVVDNENFDDPQKKPISFRGSALTKLLKESIGGNSKATILVTISPTLTDSLQTMNVLRFADRAKHLRNHAQFNEGAFCENKTRLRIVNEEHQAVLEKHKLEQKHIELLNKQAKYEQDAADLRRQQRALSSKIAQHTAMTDAERTQIKERWSQLAAEEKRARETQKAIKEEIDRLSGLETVLMKKELEKETEKIEKERLEAEIGEYINELAHLTVTAAKTNETYERQISELVNKMQDMENHQITIATDARQEASRAAADEISSLRLEMKNREVEFIQQRTSCTQTIDDQTHQIADLKETVARLERQLSTVIEEKREAEANCSISRIETTGLQQESKQLLNAFEEERERLWTTIKQEKKYRQQVSQDLQNEIEKMRTRGESVAEMHKEKLSKEIETRLEERKTLVAEKEEMRRDHRKLGLEVSTLREQNCRLQDEILRTTERVTRLDDQERKQWEAKHEWRARCQELARNLRAAGRLQKDLEEELRRTHEEYHSLARRIQKMEAVDAEEMEALKPHTDELVQEMTRKLQEYALTCRRHINGLANNQRSESRSVSREVEVIRSRSHGRVHVIGARCVQASKEREELLLNTDVMVSLNSASPKRVEDPQSGNTSPVSAPSLSPSFTASVANSGVSPLAIPVLHTPPPQRQSFDHLEQTFPVDPDYANDMSARTSYAHYEDDHEDFPSVLSSFSLTPRALPQAEHTEPEPASARSRWEQRRKQLEQERDHPDGRTGPLR